MYQGIAEDTGRLDNIVELRRRALPDLPFLPPSQPAVATLTLKHAYSIVAPNMVEITFIGTNVNVDGEPLTFSAIGTATCYDAVHAVPAPWLALAHAA